MNKNNDIDAPLSNNLLKDLYDCEKQKHDKTTKMLQNAQERLRSLEIAMQKEEHSVLHRIRNLERELDRVNKVVVCLQRKVLSDTFTP